MLLQEKCESLRNDQDLPDFSNSDLETSNLDDYLNEGTIRRQTSATKIARFLPLLSSDQSRSNSRIITDIESAVGNLRSISRLKLNLSPMQSRNFQQERCVKSQLL
jgi:hypothetical protein